MFMPKYVKEYIKEYVSNIAESNILKVYTFKNESQIQVFFKIENEEIDRIFSGQEIVTFLNYTTKKNLNLKKNMIDRKNNFTISKNVKQGIIKDVEGIRRKNGRYSYKVPVLSPEEQYEELFKSKLSDLI